MPDLNQQYLHTTEDGITRCWWGNDLDMRSYHDEEWGRPVADDFQLFEKIWRELVEHYFSPASSLGSPG